MVDEINMIFVSVCLLFQLGSATVLIGDPSGRLSERKQHLTNEDIVSNTENIERLVKLIFDNHEKYFWKDQAKKLKPVM